MTRPFHPSELSGGDGAEPTSAQLGEAMLAARALESELGASDVHPSADFADRVMGAIAVEPRPQPAVAAGLAMRGGRVGAMVAALADSWRVAFSGGRPWAVRAQAAAFVLVAIVAIGSVGGIVAVGAVRLLTPPSPSPSRPVVGPTTRPSDSPRSPDVARPSPTAELPTPSTEPSETPDATDSAEPTDGEDSGKTPEPTKTARPTRTPHETPEPTETDEPNDDGGGGGGGGGGSGSGGGSTPDP